MRRFYMEIDGVEGGRMVESDEGAYVLLSDAAVALHERNQLLQIAVVIAESFADSIEGDEHCGAAEARDVVVGFLERVAKLEPAP